MPDPAALILLYEGVSAFEALGALAALRAAERPVELVAREALVRTQEGARLVPDRLGYDALADAPALILPSGDVAKLLADAELAKALRARRGKHVLAAGEAVRLLTAAGLTGERRIARLPGDAEIPGATSVHARLVADGRVLTSFAGDALIDLALHYVAQTEGDKRAERAAHALGREYRPYAFGRTDE